MMNDKPKDMKSITEALFSNEKKYPPAKQNDKYTGSKGRNLEDKINELTERVRLMEIVILQLTEDM